MATVRSPTPARSPRPPQATPVVADVNGDGTERRLRRRWAGDILYRQGIPGQPGSFLPPVTVNPGYPSRDIAWVPNTLDGPLLASVDAQDDASRSTPFATGLRPHRITDDRASSQRRSSWPTWTATAGTTWWSAMPATAPSRSSSPRMFTGPIDLRADFRAFLPPVTLSVGLGVSDVQAVDTTGSGRLDLVVTNKLTGQVSVLLNLGNGTFAPPVPYRAGTGLSEIDPGSTPEVSSLDATAGVAAGTLTPGGPTDLVTINPGSNTMDVLAGLGGGRFANPVDASTPRARPRSSAWPTSPATASTTWPCSPPTA